MIKKGVLNQLKTIGEMVIFNIISLCLSLVSCIDKVQIGIDEHGFLPVIEYNVNLYIFIPTMIILLIFYFIFCFYFLKKRFENACSIHWGFIVLFIITIILFLIEFNGLAITIVAVGLFSRIVNIPHNFINVILIGFLTFPIVMIIYTLLNRKKTN